MKIITGLILSIAAATMAGTNAARSLRGGADNERDLQQCANWGESCNFNPCCEGLVCKPDRTLFYTCRSTHFEWPTSAGEHEYATALSSENEYVPEESLPKVYTAESTPSQPFGANDEVNLPDIAELEELETSVVDSFVDLGTYGPGSNGRTGEAAEPASDFAAEKRCANWGEWCGSVPGFTKTCCEGLVCHTASNGRQSCKSGDWTWP